MDKAWSLLETLGAVGEDGKLTALGKHMVSFQICVNVNGPVKYFERLFCRLIYAWQK
jgi:HrpA-like RNA helicase